METGEDMEVVGRRMWVLTLRGVDKVKKSGKIVWQISFNDDDNVAAVAAVAAACM